MRKKWFGLSTFELCLWIGSILLIVISFLCSEELDPLVLLASLIGATALIFVAKGYPSGQILTVVFALFYGYISWKMRYYGEMITYLGMSSPIALASAVSWFRNPYQKGKSEVRVRNMKFTDWTLLFILTGIVTGIFYFILKSLSTPNLLWGTVSVATSFVASALTLFRSPFYAIGYAFNDIVLIILWVLATMKSPGNFPMVICFVIFLINDSYGFLNWSRIQKRQQK